MCSATWRGPKTGTDYTALVTYTPGPFQIETKPQAIRF